MDEPYYRAGLALVHDLGFAGYPHSVAPGVLRCLEGVRTRGGTVLELGCGSGLLTRQLLDAGHSVIATDASPAMLELARQRLPEADLRLLALPDDPLPTADAVVTSGHPLNYLPDLASIERSLTAAAAALRPGGVLVVDLCDLAWGDARRDAPPLARVEDGWAIVTRFSLPRPDLFVRDLTTFIATADGFWHRDDERHLNVLLSTDRLPGLLATSGVSAEVRSELPGCTRPLPAGLVFLVGTKTARPDPGPATADSPIQLS